MRLWKEGGNRSEGVWLSAMRFAFDRKMAVIAEAAGLAILAIALFYPEMASAL